MFIIKFKRCIYYYVKNPQLLCSGGGGWVVGWDVWTNDKLLKKEI